MTLEKLESLGRKILGIDEILNPKKRRIRECYRYIRNKIATPSWVNHPSNIQIDTHNYCNLWQQGKGCVHCNVKPSGGWNLPRGWMDTEMIKYLIEYWGKHGASSIAPYINGEPMLDSRLPFICNYAEKHGLKVVIDTNGTLYENRSWLIHRNLREARFSFSAVTPQTYLKVHGADFYYRAKLTIEWFLKNKLKNQYPILYFITNKYNLHEIDEYVEKWKGKAHIVLFPLHEVPGIQTESEQTKPNFNYWGKITCEITGKYPKQPFRPIDIYCDGRTETRLFPFYETCQGTHSFSVSWNGYILHCTDIPYKYHYGHVYERDMLEAWRRRNVGKLLHPSCQVCNVKHLRHNEILRKYLT